MSRGGGKVGRGMVTQQRAQREIEREQHRGDRSKEIACSPLSSLSRLAAFVLRPRVLFSPRRLVGFFSTRDDHDVGPRMHILAQGSDGSHQLPSTRSAPFRLNLGREQSVISRSVVVVVVVARRVSNLDLYVKQSNSMFASAPT